MPLKDKVYLDKMEEKNDKLAEMWTEQYLRFAEYLSENGWRFIGYNKQFWVKMTNDAEDKYFARRFKTDELFEELKNDGLI